MEPSKEANGHSRPLEDVTGEQYSALPTSGGDRMQLIPNQGGDRASGSSMESGTEVSPLQMELGKQTSRCQAEGLKVIVISAISFSVAITVALIITIYFGPPQVPLHGAVACDSPVCAEVGTDILKKGGSSVDAAIAATFCLSVVHPFSASLGGGGYVIMRNNRKNASSTIDARETAPANSNLAADERPSEGGMSIAVPGLLRGLELAHKQYGKLSWDELIQPSIKLANESGFNVSQAFVDSLAGLTGENTREYVNLHGFLTQNSYKWPSLNDKLFNRELAATLNTIANEGAGAFYEGQLAREIVQQVEDRNGIITDEDFKNYKALKGQPLETSFQGMTVQTVAPPAGGALMLMMLNVMEELERKTVNESAGLSMHWFIEAQKFSGTENGHLGDPLFSPSVYNITARMISKTFAAELANASDPTSTHVPQWYSTTARQAIRDLNAPGTSTVSVIGADEVMVAISTTLGSDWGSKEMANGVVLNNQMNAFTKASDTPPDPNNKLEPGKRPASYMLPSLVFSYPKPCAVRLALGGGGGKRGPAAVAQVIRAVLEEGDDLKGAINEPRFYASLVEGKVFYEDGGDNSTSPGVLRYLEAVGDVLEPVRDIGSTVNAAAKINETVTAYGDPRNGGAKSVF